MRSDELGRSIRAWRDRLEPAEAGLPAGALRRVPGRITVDSDILTVRRSNLRVIG